MATFEIQGADGQIYEVQADTMEAAAQALSSVTTPAQGGSTANTQAMSELGSGIDATIMGAHNGGFLGFGDNLQGVKSAILGQSLGDDKLSTDYSGTIGERYDRGVDQYRQRYAKAEAEHPKQVFVGNVMGATIPALATSGVATGQSLLGTAFKGGGIGAIEGMLQGLGNSDGQDMMKNAGWGALLGGGLGLAAAPLVQAGVAIKNAMKDPVTGVVDSMRGTANVGKANRAILGGLKSSGNKADDIAAMLAKAAQQGQPEFRLMDALGTSGQRQASGLARQGGDAGTEIADFLKQRQLDQGDRVGGFVEDAFGLRGTTAAKTTDALTAARGTAADAAYSAARGNAAPVNLNDTIATIDSLTKRDPILGESALADTVIGKRLKALRAQMATGDQQLIDFDSVLNIKQDMFATMEGLRKSGKTVPKELSDVYGALDGALEGSSDMYRTANDGFRDASKVIGAVDDGAAMSKGGRYGDNVPAFNAMTPDQQGAARIGYGDDLMGKLERVTAPTANRAAPLRSTKRVNEADAMTLDPALYRDRLGRENTMWETQNRALGGSRTADNMADQEAMSQLAGGAMDAAKSAANLQFGDTVAKIGSMLGPIAKGQNDATRQLIAKALMSGDSSVLAPALRQSATSESKRRMIEALLRQTTREGVNALGRQ